MAEVQRKDNPVEAEDEDEPCYAEVVAEPVSNKQEDVSEPHEEKEGPQKPIEASKSLDLAEAEAKARHWVREGLQRLVEEAAGKMEEAKAKKDNAEAALWDLRRAAAVLAIEAMS